MGAAKQCATAGNHLRVGQNTAMSETFQLDQLGAGPVAVQVCVLHTPPL